MILRKDAVELRLIQRKKALESKVAGREASERSRLHARTVEIPMVEYALIRLREGEYGECIDCGETIEEDRLEAIPEIPTCKACGRAHDVKKGVAHVSMPRS